MVVIGRSRGTTVGNTALREPLVAPPEPCELRAAGGLHEARASLHRPRSVAELAAVFADARRRGVRLTLVGGRRSFGEQFLPSPGAEAVDTTGITTDAAQALPTDVADGDELWVRAPAATTFEELARCFPGYLPHHPPTGDRITLAGALAACTHDAVGYFADAVRAFTLMTPDGRTHRCHAGAEGRAGALYRLVPGSFGALGVLLDMELRLHPARDEERAEMVVLDKAPHDALSRTVERLERLTLAGEYPLRRGIFFFGRRGPAALMGCRQVLPAPGQRLRQPPLADDAHAKNVYLQGLANRFPGLVYRLLPLGFSVGRRFHARLYPFAYFQRSYDRADELLHADGLVPRLLRGIGVDPRLTVCHTTYAIPVAHRHDFLRLYFERFDAHRDLGPRVENQDLIRLPPCRWPLHATHELREGAYLFSPSFSVRRGTPTEARARAFLDEVGRLAYDQLGVKVLLLKQSFVEPALLRRMHAPFLDALRAARDLADPERRLGSRLLDVLDPPRTA